MGVASEEEIIEKQRRQRIHDNKHLQNELPCRWILQQVQTCVDQFVEAVTKAILGQVAPTLTCSAT